VYRDLLPDDGNVFFSHGDLTLGNIIISPEPNSPTKIAAIIDWEQAGWYPEYWDCSMLSNMITGLSRRRGRSIVPSQNTRCSTRDRASWLPYVHHEYIES
jgi:aminoglycoside phosphotransferase (APT) family kinase protein